MRSLQIDLTKRSVGCGLPKHRPSRHPGASLAHRCRQSCDPPKVRCRACGTASGPRSGSSERSQTLGGVACGSVGWSCGACSWSAFGRCFDESIVTVRPWLRPGDRREPSSPPHRGRAKASPRNPKERSEWAGLARLGSPWISCCLGAVWPRDDRPAWPRKSRPGRWLTWPVDRRLSSPWVRW